MYAIKIVILFIAESCITLHWNYFDMSLFLIQFVSSAPLLYTIYVFHFTVCTVPSISFIFTRLRLSRNCCTVCANSRAWLISLKIASAEKSTFRFLDAIFERPGNNNTLYATTPLRYYGIITTCLLFFILRNYE